MKTVYLSRFNERNWLDYFWTVSREPDVNRVELLQKMAAVAVSWRREPNVREQSRKDRETFQVEANGCFCCRARDRAFVWHHVIQVQHGGSSGIGNQVPLCGRCHAEVHPWLVPDVIPRSTWTNMRQLVTMGVDILERIFSATRQRA